MGKKKAPLSPMGIKKRESRIDGMHAIGHPPGLYLYVKGICKAWMLRYTFGGKRRDMSLGPYDEITLEQAQDRAICERAKIREGIDPLAVRHADKQAAVVAKAKTITFKECAEKYIAAHRSGWKNAKHGDQWVNTLHTYAFPIIGDLPADAVDTGLILQILEPLWATKTETATRLRGRIESVLDWATVRGYRQGENPARWRGHLDTLLPRPSRVAKVEHHPALPYADMPSFWPLLLNQMGTAALALQFTILTATRSGEVRGATWTEINLDAATWTIPAERMKAEREHRVPLSAQAIDLLKRVPKIHGCDLVFPGQKNQPLSDMSLTAVLRRMERRDITVHGFRSTFRDWVSERTAYPREVAEMALAHSVGNAVEAAYRRGDLFDKRRRLMADWATYVTTPVPESGTIIQFKLG